MYKLKKIALKISQNYALDLRALSLMRIGVALLVITDLIIRATDLSAHYTDEGLWPTFLIHNFGWNGGYWSFHSLSGTYTLQFILFSLHFIFSLFLLLGFKTRFFTVVVWLLTISLHNRNLFVLQAGDDLLRLVLLWGIFLPWNACYSMDALKTKVRIRQNVFSNLGYLLLIASVYFFSANLKFSEEWHHEGSAVYYALSLEQLRLPFGDWLYQFPFILKLLTWIIYYLELLVPFLILWPAKKGYLRLIAFVLLAFLHAGIGLSLFVGLFFLIGMVSAIGLLPSFAIDKVEALFGKKENIVLPKNEINSSLKKWSTSTVCAFLIFLCVFVNLGTVSWFSYEPADVLTYPINTLRLNQYWGMFSPGVLKKDGWFVHYGRDSIGRQWDLRRNEDYVDFSKPKHIVNLYKNDRWRKLAENMQSDKYTFLHPLYCKYILQTWNKKHPKRKMKTLNVYFMMKENLPDYKSTLPVKNLHCLCYDE